MVNRAFLQRRFAAKRGCFASGFRSRSYGCSISPLTLSFFLGGMALLNTSSAQSFTKEKRYSSDNGYFTGGRPSTETPPGNRSGLNFKDRMSNSDSQSLESDTAKKSSVENLNDALHNIITPSVSWFYCNSVVYQKHPTDIVLFPFCRGLQPNEATFTKAEIFQPEM